ncbi:helix-turn-helix transcriptional regulator [Corynebacterium aquatimens]|uniref:Y4mF family transcriptional regulator n=1 Tax=Corynebacterium aquatimens TaxID=1190508 RepID=A0A931E1E1_9CORY|nr:helix-turn-helix transcriptional regulator [Corynebacterium aquatimens]MBG6122944.1 y4mF family transcriptional regulator [Corynebacterium aquatimens]WJY66721.1 Helix-turn-helix protein [Corynebacterium aquatimens]
MGVEHIGAAVRQERRNLGLTQVELANLAQVSDRFVRDLEHGKETLEMGKAIRVLGVLGYELAPVSRNPMAARGTGNG